MDKFHISSQACLSTLFMTLFAAGATAASLDFNTRSICKSKDRIIERAQVTAGMASTICVVDIRQADIKDYMKERIKSGENTPPPLPWFKGMASSHLVLTPALSQAVSTQGIDNNTGSVSEQYSQPFIALTDAMTEFTGDNTVGLNFEDGPPWLNLPSLNNNQYRIQTTLSVQQMNAIPQAVVPLPAAGILFISGLITYTGLVWHGRRRRHSGSTVPRHPAGSFS